MDRRRGWSSTIAPGHTTSSASTRRPNVRDLLASNTYEAFKTPGLMICTYTRLGKVHLGGGIRAALLANWAGTTEANMRRSGGLPSDIFLPSRFDANGI